MTKAIPSSQGKRRREENTTTSPAVDLRDTYKAPFLIRDDDEGNRFRSLSTRKIVQNRWFDFGVLEKLGLKLRIEELSEVLGWRKFIETPLPTYEILTLEFFTTLKVDKDLKFIQCRLNGGDFKVDYAVMNTAFGFPEDGCTEMPKSFCEKASWCNLTGLANFCMTNPSNGFISDHAYLLLHKFMCHGIYGKQESNKASRPELFLLACLQEKKPVSTTYQVFQAMSNTLNRSNGVVGLGHFATGLAQYYKVLHTTSLPLPLAYLSHDTLVRAEIITTGGTLLCPRERNCWKSLAAPPMCASSKENPFQATTSTSTEGAIEATLATMMAKLDEHSSFVRSELGELKACLTPMEREQAHTTSTSTDGAIQATLATMMAKLDEHNSFVRSELGELQARLTTMEREQAHTTSMLRQLLARSGCGLPSPQANDAPHEGVLEP